MSVKNDQIGCATSRVEAFRQSLDNAVVGGKHQKEADFAEAYPFIEQHLSRKVPLKVVMETFGKAYGYVVHAPRFRNLLQAQRMCHGESGDVVACVSCGQQLPTSVLAPQNAVNGQEHENEQ